MARFPAYRVGAALVLAAVCAGGACTSESEPPEPAAREAPAFLSPTDHLVRASMALRGIRPSIDELRAVAADPGALPGIVDAYLQSPEFGRTLRDMHNEALLVRPDFAYFPAGFQALAPLADRDLYTINRSIMEAPLRLIEHVVTNDRPYSEIVTADYTLANDVVAAVWDGIEGYDPAGEEWQVVRWGQPSDPAISPRPSAGILSDPWLFQRHSSTNSNANRGRANAVSRALLCYDFLSRDIELDSSVNLADPNVVQNAVVQNAACASCHQTLDPLASFLQGHFPIYVPEQIPAYPFNSYFPDVFEAVLQIEMRDPAFFGKAGADLVDLGAMIAEDPRFSLCAATRFHAYLNRIDVESVPLEAAAAMQRAFIESGMSARALARAVVLSDDFRISHAMTPEDAEDLVGLRRARPEQIASMIEDLTGFRWQVDFSMFNLPQLGTIELPLDTFIGYQVLGGGIDSASVTRPGHTDSATTSLFLRAFAAEAAAYVVETDLAAADPAARRLLTLSAADVDEAAVRAELSRLHARIYGELAEPGDEAVGETFGLWKAVLDRSGDARRAWKATLTAMLQDVRIAYY